MSDQNAPNKILLEWLKTNSTRDENVKAADVKELEGKFPTDYENLEPYVLNDDLMKYLTLRQFKWLRFGGRIDSVAKFEWVCSLSNTMGLQLDPDSGSLEGFDLRLLKELPEIRWLVFYYKWPTDEKGVFPELPKLQVLLARGSGVTDEQIGNIANLSALSLYGSSVTDAGVECLVRKNPSLKYLNIGDAKSITPKSIAVLGNLKELKYLYVGHTELATEKWFRELEKALPSCKLERGN